MGGPGPGPAPPVNMELNRQQTTDNSTLPDISLQILTDTTPHHTTEHRTPQHHTEIYNKAALFSLEKHSVLNKNPLQSERQH